MTSEIRKLILLLLVSTIILSVKGQPVNDERANALMLNNITSWVSNDSEFSTIGATGNDFSGGPWGGYHNVWFKFLATTSEIDIRLLAGESKGTLIYPSLKFFDAAGNVLNTDNATQNISLVPGATYYFSVDDNAGTPGTFSLKINDEVDYDMRAKAKLLSNIHEWQSADAAFNTSNATGKGFNEELWTAYQNVWFKFIATTSEIDIELLSGGSKGTLYPPSLKLFNSAGNSIAVGAGDGIRQKLQEISLTMGAVYYISVDHAGETAGTFTLKVNDVVSYDLRAKAEVIQHLPEWCSSDAQYSNLNATRNDTRDGIGNGNCGDLYHNVWFKFQATSNSISIKVNTGQAKGTLNTPIIYLEDNGGTKITCSTGQTSSQSLEYNSLTAGAWYYLTIDSHVSMLQGTFTLCLNGGAAPSALCENIFCTSEGGVGIGTPLVPGGYRMAVLGKIIAEGVKVELKSKWPDYVFENDYQLKKLSEVKEYIKANGHLPEIPAATEVENEGIDLGEMNSLLLRKLEEMTLYMIRLEERVNELESKKKK